MEIAGKKFIEVEKDREGRYRDKLNEQIESKGEEFIKQGDEEVAFRKIFLIHRAAIEE